VEGKQVRGLASGLIATVGGDFYDDGRKDADGWTFSPPLDTAANATLIAAATDLLAALIRMDEEFGTQNYTKSADDVVTMAQAAIKKATGGE
jgi:hypothetical protein